MDSPPPPYSQLINEEDFNDGCSEVQPSLMPPPYEQHNQPLNVHSTDRDNPHRFQQPAHQYSMQPSRSEVLIQRSLLVVVVNGDRSRVDDSARLANSFCGHIFLSCLVLWFCGIIGGFKAFMLALKARQLSQEGRHVEAELYGHASIKHSIIGVIAGIIFISILVGIVVYVNRGNVSGDESISNVQGGTRPAPTLNVPTQQDM